MKLDSFIHYTNVDLMPGVPLNVYAIKGEYFSVLIDTGINQMRNQILELCKETGQIKNILITHAHADHIGCNKTVKENTKAEFCAAGAIDWIEDLDIHYKEFCIPSDDLPDSPEQHAEIMGLMDGAVHVDLLIKEETSFRLGKNIELKTLAFPGHKLEEVGFLEVNSGTLFMGDVLLALAAPFFHGFQTAKGFRNTLNRIVKMLESGEVKRILPAHHPPLAKNDAFNIINKTHQFLDDVEGATLNAANGVTFSDLWKKVCNKLNKQLEFRGYAMLQVQVDELISEGKLYKVDKKIFKR